MIIELSQDYRMNPQQVVSKPRFRAIQGFIGNGSRSVLKENQRRVGGVEVLIALLFETEESADVARYAMSSVKKEEDDVCLWKTTTSETEERKGRCNQSGWFLIL